MHGMGGLGDEASHLADPHPTALTMSVNLTVRYTFQHGPTGCSISLMDSVLLGYNGLFILSLSWTSFFSQKWPCDIIRLSTFIHGPYFTLNEPSLLPTVYTSKNNLDLALSLILLYSCKFHLFQVVMPYTYL